MPVVPYYQGRAAVTWTLALSRPARAAANPVASSSPAGPRPAAPAARRRTPQEPSASVAAWAGNGAWEAWASFWFTPDH